MLKNLAIVLVVLGLGVGLSACMGPYGYNGYGYNGYNGYGYNTPAYYGPGYNSDTSHNPHGTMQ
jgi:hypothetical protein